MRNVLNNKVLLLIVAILLLANIALLVSFVGMKKPEKNISRDERQRPPMTVFLDKELGFNQQQMEQFDTLRQRHRQKNEAVV